MTLSFEIETRPTVDISYIKKRIGSNNHYASLVGYRLHKRGKLKRITRNKYTAINNIYVIATQLYTPCYLSFWSASSYLGATLQILNTLQLVTMKRHKTIEFENYKIKFIVLPKRFFFGYSRVETTQGSIFVVDPEKLIIDSLLRPQEMGNFDEIVKIAQYFSMDVEKLVKYLIETKNNSVMKRAGFLLEEYKKIDISSRLKIKDGNYISLNPFAKKSTTIISKWRVRL